MQVLAGVLGDETVLHGFLHETGSRDSAPTGSSAGAVSGRPPYFSVGVLLTDNRASLQCGSWRPRGDVPTGEDGRRSSLTQLLLRSLVTAAHRDFKVTLIKTSRFGDDLPKLYACFSESGPLNKHPMSEAF